jgi:hypothetical protein
MSVETYVLCLPNSKSGNCRSTSPPHQHPSEASARCNPAAIRRERVPRHPTQRSSYRKNAYDETVRLWEREEERDRVQVVNERTSLFFRLRITTNSQIRCRHLLILTHLVGRMVRVILRGFSRREMCIGRYLSMHKVEATSTVSYFSYIFI